MFLCNDGHEEICYTGREECQACEFLKQISDFEDNIYDLKEQILELKDKIKEVL